MADAVAGTKACLFCAEQIQAAAKLCRFCGREQVDPKLQHAEEIYYDGPVLHRTFLGEHIMYGAISIAGVAGLIYLLSQGSSVWYLAFVLIAIGLLGTLVRVIRTTTMRWKITSQRIQTERGILSKKIDVVELYRVEDIVYSQTLLQRILGEATIKLVTLDQTTPTMLIQGITNTRDIYERLRVAVNQRRKEQRVLVTESHPA
jgi:uncharacterized membrane protein YdbT with pleckstrin-like domain